MRSDHELFTFIAGISLILFLLPGMVSFTPARRRWMRRAAAVVLGVGMMIALYRTAAWMIAGG